MYRCVKNCVITICSRAIRHTWHFYYALVLVVKALCGGFGIACLTS
ncbi:TPA: DUF3265 domain-containing protein [Vibrio parahaemolyticus]|nr:DUF3265 domain-containing protein [Vibrio parahaemolyticus]